MRTYRVQYLLKGPRPHQGPGDYVIGEEDGRQVSILGPYDRENAERVAHQLNSRISRAIEYLSRNSEIRRQVRTGA